MTSRTIAILQARVGSSRLPGKVLKPKTILARSADGNVRVQDVVRIYATDGQDGLSELAWTSPFTKYIIEAFDAC